MGRWKTEAFTNFWSTAFTSLKHSAPSWSQRHPGLCVCTDRLRVHRHPVGFGGGSLPSLAGPTRLLSTTPSRQLSCRTSCLSRARPEVM